MDRKTFVVLDGMHRVATIGNLGCRFIPACLVDYDNPNILIGSWYRLVNQPSDLGGVLNSIKELGLTVEDCPMEAARELVEKREAITSIVSQSECFAVYGTRKNIKEIYDVVKKIELKLISEGYLMSYDTENGVQEMVSSDKALSALVVPTVSKEEVIKMALTRRVFVHKTTRHVISSEAFIRECSTRMVVCRVKPQRSQ